MKKIILLISLLLLSPLSYAEDMIDSYTTRLSSEDHFNSDGQRLKSAADIIRQDRANYHKFGIRDDKDQGDGFFDDKNNRERIPNMLKRGSLDKETKGAILNGTPMVLVNIYRNHIDVFLLEVY